MPQAETDVTYWIGRNAWPTWAPGSGPYSSLWAAGQGRPACASGRPQRRMRAVDPLPDTYYAKTPDGVYIAYQVIGDGPIDVVWQSDWPGNIDIEQEESLGKAWIREVASFSRL